MEWKWILTALGSVLISVVGAVTFSFTTFDMKDAAKERYDFLNQQVQVLRQEQKDSHDETMEELRRLDEKISRAAK